MSPPEATERYVILGDVIDSASIEDRSAFRTTLAAGLERVNDEFSADIHTDFELLKGIDEFGGVLTSLSRVYELLATILESCHPTMVRFAVAGGQIDVEPSNEIHQLDGEAFHSADTLLTAVEDDDLYCYVDTGRAVDTLLAISMNLLLGQRAGWTPRQADVVRAYERQGTQAAAASELGIRQQAVSKSLRQIDYFQTKLLREHLLDVLPVIYGE
ncbi:SatD family protein [Natronosalvus vescus]|uniref:SatD family protein n=1 Tax=Natronosalvus vescus TaxID=2953881 RepID=UPI00208FFFDF|nr:SatD family protein [Natronosalvus vescus]